MRFARYWCHRDTGEVLAVLEQETPFEGGEIIARLPDGTIVPVASYDLGLVEDFVPTTLEGESCSPAQHLYQRVLHRDDLGTLHVHPGETLPEMHDCPATAEGIRQRLRERGLQGLPAKGRAWLAFMLPPREVEALGVASGIPLSVFKALDTMRSRRDAQYGSRREILERMAQERSDRDAEVRHSRRLAAAMKEPAAEGDAPLTASSRR